MGYAGIFGRIPYAGPGAGRLPLMPELRIGPVTVTALSAPTKNAAYTSEPVVMSMDCMVQSRVEAVRMAQLVANDDRRQSWGGHGGHSGVLEHLSWRDAHPLSEFDGWYLLTNAEFTHDVRTMARPHERTWLPFTLELVWIGPARPAKVASTHEERPNDFTLAGVPLVAPLYPFAALDTIGGPTFDRPAFGGVQMALRPDATTDTRLRSLTTDDTMLRPALLDSDGNPHYGPVTTAVGMRTGHFRATLDPATGIWSAEVVAPSTPGAWTDLGTLEVLDPVAASRPRHVLDARVHDDGVSMLLADDQGHVATVMLRSGDYGLRIRNADVDRDVVTEAALDPLVANHYRESAAGPEGGRRFIALRSTAVSSDPPNGTVRIGASHDAFFGFEPASPQTEDTAGEQGRQLLHDRRSLLVLE